MAFLLEVRCRAGHLLGHLLIIQFLCSRHVGNLTIWHGGSSKSCFLAPTPMKHLPAGAVAGIALIASGTACPWAQSLVNSKLIPESVDQIANMTPTAANNDRCSRFNCAQAVEGFSFYRHPTQITRFLISSHQTWLQVDRHRTPTPTLNRRRSPAYLRLSIAILSLLGANSNLS